MSEKPISDLRRRMLEDMAVRKLGEKTRHDYIRHVEAFARFLGRARPTRQRPRTAPPGASDRERVQPPTLNSSASALRFFGITLDRAELARHLARVHYPGSCLVFSRRRRWVVFSKRHPVRPSSTRRR